MLFLLRSSLRGGWQGARLTRRSGYAIIPFTRDIVSARAGSPEVFCSERASMDLLFLFQSAAFGVGLAMDAFSVSLADGLNEPEMKRRRMCLIAGTYAGFQTAMPLIGYFLVRGMATAFAAFRPWIPWIALALLLYLGGKMLIEGLRKPKPDEDPPAPSRLHGASLLLQGVATSIDALSVGFTTAELPWTHAATQAAMIGAITFVICIGGLLLGRAVGMKLARKASILGGVILIAIGIEIFVTGILK